jgi:hypothetical protein
MIDRHRAFRLALATLGVAMLVATMLLSVAQAQQSFQRFTPFLIDLPGWKANKPDGAAMEAGGSSMVTATRTYERGSAKVNAVVLQGSNAQLALASIKSGLKIETNDMRMGVSTVDGMQVGKSYNIRAKNGGMVVALSDTTAFTLSYEGIDEDEAMGLAKKFDWKAIQAKAQVK